MHAAPPPRSCLPPWVSAILSALCWRTASKAHLSVGVVLHLDFMRTMILVFIAATLLAIPTMLNNVTGRFLLSNVDNDIVSFISVAPSFAAYAPADFTPVKGKACSGNGFAARVCSLDGWTAGVTDAYDYVCGKAPTSVPLNAPSSYILAAAGALKTYCTKSEVYCVCIPGYTGTDCSTKTTTQSMTTVPGFCSPVKEWWKSAVGSTARTEAEAYNLATRKSTVCSGRGSCGVKLQAGKPTTARLSFCQCDSGYYGEQCQNSNTNATEVGSSFNYPLNAASTCLSGTIPTSALYTVDIMGITAKTCSTHGFGVRLSPQTGGLLLSTSNFYRPQTLGVCVCEPGYSGEECLGGPSLPTISGVFASATCVVFALAIIVAYRRRKTTQQLFDDKTVTPSDFTVLAEALPSLRWDADAPDGGPDVVRVRAHFAVFGPVHDVSPALADSKMLLLVRERHVVMRAFAALLERTAPDNCEGIARTNTADTRIKQQPAWYPRSLPRALLAHERGYGATLELRPEYIVREADAAAAAASPTMTLRTRTIGRVAPALLNRDELASLLRFLNGEIAAAAADPASKVFKSAFVTFAYAEDAKATAHFYHLAKRGSADIINARTRTKVDASLDLAPPVDAAEGAQAAPVRIRVRKACEPDEVQWENLDASFMEQSGSVFGTLAYFVGVCIALLYTVRAMNASPSNGATGFGIAIAIIVLSKVVTVHWAFIAQLERPHTFGGFTRSVFLKSFVQTSFVTLFAATIGVYGVPVDSKNGYILDWFLTAGGYLLRTTLVEAFLPPLMLVAALPFRLGKCANARTRSHVQWLASLTPPRVKLEQHCATLMRHVLVGCIFSPGLPVLYPATLLTLVVHYLADNSAIDGVYRLHRIGPELARVLEVSLFASTIAQVAMAFILFRLGADESTNYTVEITFIVLMSLLVWLALGYLTFKRHGVRDCCCGLSKRLPTAVRAALRTVNEPVMRVALGPGFYGETDAIDETSGLTYAELVAEAQRVFSERHEGALSLSDAYKGSAPVNVNSFSLLRARPYVSVERADVYTSMRGSEPDAPIWSPAQYNEWVHASEARKTDTAFRDGTVVASPASSSDQAASPLARTAAGDEDSTQGRFVAGLASLRNVLSVF